MDSRRLTQNIILGEMQIIVEDLSEIIDTSNNRVFRGVDFGSAVLDLVIRFSDLGKQLEQTVTEN